MGDYLNPGYVKFQLSLNSEIYVDKSEMINKINALIGTEKRFVCISRPRRFGKTMSANILAAYYSYGEDASHLFRNLKISNDSSWKEHLNQYNCIALNMQEFLSGANTVREMLEHIKEYLVYDFKEAYPEVKYRSPDNFVQVMKDVYSFTKRPFIILIDEWDCLFREYKGDLKVQEKYLDFLRLWLKDQAYVGLAYMTGILPIKKYGTHSALNMFWEYSMTNPSQFVDFFGFTECEVEQLDEKYGMSMEEIRAWYNGYFLESGSPIYNPTSVVQCLMRKVFDNYWNKTETYEALTDYVRMNFDGLKDKIVAMIAGDSVKVNTGSFSNEMANLHNTEDVLTLLIHLGYLSYDFAEGKVRIPNQEVRNEFATSVSVLGWSGVVDAIQDSEKLLKSIWNMEEEAVASYIQEVHEKNASALQYNNENSLSCTISLALYVASEYYTVVREFPSGKGFADLVYIPRKKFSDKPAMIVELKWNKDVSEAVLQIKNKNYVSALKEYQGNLLLVGINYNQKTKKHSCLIERHICNDL